MSEMTNAVRATATVPPWPNVDLTGDLHPSRVIHDALRGIPGALVERSIRDGGDWKAAVGLAGVVRVLTYWPMYLLAAHEVRLLRLLYPDGTNHNVWDGSENAVPLDRSRLREAEGLYSRKWGVPLLEYQRKVAAFQDWSL